MKIPQTASKSVDAIVNLVPVGEKTLIRTADIASAAGVNKTDLNRARRLLEGIGSLETTITREPYAGGTKVYYLLKDTPTQVWDKINKTKEPSYAVWRAKYGGEKELLNRMNGGIRRSERESVVEPMADPIVAVSEDKMVENAVEQARERAQERIAIKAENPFATLAPMRKSEPRALVEAARQYINKVGVARDHIRALVEAGVASEDTLMAAINLQPDDRFETISQVLPYIEELEHRVNNLEKYNEPLRTKAARVDALESENRRLRQHNERLIAEKVRNGS